MVCTLAWLAETYPCSFLSILDGECAVSDKYHAKLQPEAIAKAVDGEHIILRCCTNLPAAYPSQWEINSEVFEITRLPSGFFAIGLDLEFEFISEVTVRCLFKIYSDGIVMDICSNTTTIG